MQQNEEPSILNQSEGSQRDEDDISKLIPSSGFDFSILGSDNEPEIKERAISKAETASLEIRSIIDEAKTSKIKEIKARVEAVLFLSEKPRMAESIAQQIGMDANLVQQGLTQLVQEYEERDGGLMIDCTHGYCMQIRDEYENLTEDLLPIELRTAVLRTLSTIALKEPLVQSDLVKIRGGGAYEHVKELVEIGLVKRTKDGNSNILHTTKYFAENFKLSQNGVELQDILKKASPSEVEFIRPADLEIKDETTEEESIENDSNEPTDLATES